MKNLIKIFSILLLFSINNTDAQNVGVSDVIFTPQGMLHVYKSTAGPSSLFQVSNVTSGSTATDGLLFDFDASFNITFNNRENTYLQFNTNGAQRMRILSTGQVGINKTPDITFFLDVTNASTTVGDGAIWGSATGNAAVYGIKGSITSTTNTAAGIFGNSGGATGQTHGVLGINVSTTDNASGVRGYASGATGATFGVWGENASTTGYGVYGIATANGGTGVYGLNNSTGTGSQYGVYGSKSGATGTGTGYGVYGTGTGTGTTNYGGYFTASSATSNNYGIYGNASGTGGYGVYGYSSSITDGVSGVFGYNTTTGANTGYGITQIRSGVTGRQNWGQSYHFGVAGYVYDDQASFPYGGVIGAASTLINPSVWGALGYRVNATTEFGGFFNGNSRTTGYLLVGNPTSPDGVGVANTIFYHIVMSPSDYWNFTENYCDVSTNWFVPATNYMYYVANGASRSNQRLYSPFFWIPNGYSANTAYIQINHSSALEAGFDGAYMAYTVNGGAAWTTLSNANWSAGTYNDLAVVGSGTTCLDLNIPMWTSGFAQQTSTSTAITSTKNNWMQLRIAAAEDVNTGGGLEYRVYEVWVKGTMDFFSAGFMTGGIYAEGHVYAQSSAQLGDVAEYFPVDGNPEKGDLISMDANGGGLCLITNTAMDNHIIGVYSTAPSVLVNDPKQGIPIGLTGRVPINTTDENGEILPGDFLTSSSTKGKAMKAIKPCFIIGRAMGKDEKGKIICLLNPGWYNPTPSSETVSSGNYSILKNTSKIKVFDNSVRSNSKVFISMRANPESSFWVSEINDGFFEISFDKALTKDIPFDFLVNNFKNRASNITSVDEGKISEKIIEKEEIQNNNITSEVAWEILGNEGGIDKSRFSEYINKKPPSSPPDPNKCWTWDPINGFKEVK